MCVQDGCVPAHFCDIFSTVVLFGRLAGRCGLFFGSKLGAGVRKDHYNSAVFVVLKAFLECRWVFAVFFFL